MSNKEIAKDFILKCAGGKADEAFKLYVAQGFKHHNVYFKGDANTLMNAMMESDKHMPHKSFDVKRVIHDNDLVAIHSHMKPDPTHLGYAVMHIMRFNNYKIAEMWDFGQEVPKDTPNENGMF